MTTTIESVPGVALSVVTDSSTVLTPTTNAFTVTGSKTSSTSFTTWSGLKVGVVVGALVMGGGGFTGGGVGALVMGGGGFTVGVGANVGGAVTGPTGAAVGANVGGAVTGVLGTSE